MKSFARWVIEYELKRSYLEDPMIWFLSAVFLANVLGIPFVFIYLGYSFGGMFGAFLGILVYIVIGVKLFQFGNQFAKRREDEDWYVPPDELEFKKDFWRFAVAGWLYPLYITLALAKDYAYSNNHAEAK